jgi:aspartyl-tRNA(Asn)/glutamyl-tRNA(Gln) amidotransferase subunit B
MHAILFRTRLIALAQESCAGCMAWRNPPHRRPRRHRPESARPKLVDRPFSAVEAGQSQEFRMLDLAFTPPSPKVIAGARHDWELVIGMEIHAQVASNAKLFSGASTAVGAEPNSNVAFVDAAMPGMLPVINEFCVEQAVRTGLGLKAAINLVSAFDRKNYFYPDLPQGYQISQLYAPLVGEGEVIVGMGPGVARRVRIERIHLEQDAGKSIHDMDPTMSFVDFNRTGVALMEIVSRPDIRGPEEAAAYVAKLRQILRYLGTCDGNMQNGNLRADVNVSVCRPGQYEKYQATQDFGHLGTRCEIKNMNSMRFIQMAIEYEARRQIAILEDGGMVEQETRLYDPDRNETRSMRSKEEAQDYRYFPCPDLLPLEIEQAWVDGIAAAMPELPDDRKARFMRDFGLTDYDASVLTSEKNDGDYFDETIARLRFLWGERGPGNKIGFGIPPREGGSHLDVKFVANWIINNLFGRLKKDNLEISESRLSPQKLSELLILLVDLTISNKMAKDLFEILWTEGGNPAEVAAARGMKQVTDTAAIEAALDALIAANPDQVAKAKVNAKLAGWFTGQVLKATGGTANPAVVNQMVARKLGL